MQLIDENVLAMKEQLVTVSKIEKDDAVIDVVRSKNIRPVETFESLKKRKIRC